MRAISTSEPAYQFPIAQTPDATSSYPATPLPVPRSSAPTDYVDYSSPNYQQASCPNREHSSTSTPIDTIELGDQQASCSIGKNETPGNAQSTTSIDSDDTEIYTSDDDDKEWTVVNILDSRIRNGRRLYRVRWANTWVESSRMQCDELIGRYRRRLL